MLSLCQQVLMGAKNSRLGVAILHKSARMHHADENRLRKSTKTLAGNVLLVVTY